MPLSPLSRHESRRPKSSPVRLAAGVASLALVAGLVGCETTGFISPFDAVVDPKKENQLNADGSAEAKTQVILRDLDLGVPAPDDAFANARDVRAGDQEVQSTDYRMGPGDLLRINLNEYPAPGPNIEVLQVSDTGNINLTDVGERNVDGMTVTEAAREIEDAYEDAGLLQPGAARATVLVVEAQNRAYFVMGAVATPQRFLLLKPDLRLLEALAAAGATTEPDFAAEFIYIIRETGNVAPTPGRRPAGGDRNNPGVRPGGNDPLQPQSKAPVEMHDIYEASKEFHAYASAATVQPAQNFEFQAPADPSDREIIRVPFRELLGGDLKFNIPIRAGDLIMVKAPSTGNYYMHGHFNVTGTYQIIPGNEVTVMDAVIAARGFDEVAIPGRGQLIRRIGDQHVYVRLDLKNIFLGVDPDIYIQPDDKLMVGTNLPAPFLAAVRNGFRVTYGGGAIFDRNFARDDDDPFGF